MKWDEQAIQVIKDLDEGKTNKFRASIQLSVCVRTVQRKLRAYRKGGMECFKHGNTGKEPVNKIDMQHIIDFIQNHKLSGCNFTELCRLLKEYGNIQVSSSCVRKRLFLEGYLSAKCKQKTRKKLRKFLRELEKRNELPREAVEMLSALNKESLIGVWHHPTKSSCLYFGERLEMDASSFVWIEGLGVCTLHVCIDDASGFIVGLWLEREETLHGYYKLMEQVLTNYGIPLKLRTDKRTVFIYNNKGKSDPEKDTMTQFAFACHQLGVELSCSSDPNFKPKVERAHQTLQGMLPFRFSMEKITSIEMANAYLQERFIPYFNNLFGYNYDMIDGKRKTIESVFVSCSAEQIRSTLAVLCERTVNKGSTIQLDKRYMALLDERGRRIALPYSTKVTVARLLDGTLYATRGESCYALEPVPRRYAFSPDVDQHPPEPKPKPIPQKVPQSHPWSFKRQMQFKEHDAMMKKLAPSYVSPYESQYA